MTLLRAKRAMEQLPDTGRSFVELPMVEDAAVLAADLAHACIAAAPVQPPRLIDVRALRERLGLNREQFATRLGLEVETLRNWESGRREPDTTARSYLRAIANDPSESNRPTRQRQLSPNNPLQRFLVTMPSAFRWPKSIPVAWIMGRAFKRELRQQARGASRQTQPIRIAAATASPASRFALNRRRHSAGSSMSRTATWRPSSTAGSASAG